MKRLMLVSLLLLAVAAPAMGAHAADFVATGTILVSNPSTRTIGGVTEIVSPCLGSIDPDVPAGAAQGVDGFWIALPAGVPGHAATLTSTAPNDVDAWFYDEGCALITPSLDANAYSMTQTDCLPPNAAGLRVCPEPNGDEAGTIPVAASWVVVDLYVGANATFTFTVPA